jgi:hypothetical protein
MSYKRFNYSYATDSGADTIALETGALVVNSSGQLRLHDGNTPGGNPIAPPAYTNSDVATYLANYDGTINFVASPAGISGLQIITTVSAEIGTIVNNLTPATGTIVENIEVYAGGGAPYTYVWIGLNPVFTNWYNTYGSSLVGWTLYPTGYPEQAVTITDYGLPLGGPALGFSGAIPYLGTYTAHSPDYVPPVQNKVNVNVNSHNWEFNTDGKTTFPVATVPLSSTGATGDKRGMIAFDANYIYYCVADYVSNVVVAHTGIAEDHFDFGANYGFNKFLTDVTGWTLSAPGISASNVTVTSVDQNLNNGAQTGLSFSASVTFTSTDTFTFTAPSQPNIWNRTAQTGGSW